MHGTIMSDAPIFPFRLTAALKTAAFPSRVHKLKGLRQVSLASHRSTMANAAFIDGFQLSLLLKSHTGR